MMPSVMTVQNDPVNESDPFRYGWRYIKDQEGRISQVPLTLEDILHPQEGDFHVTSDDHARDMRYLAYVCEQRLQGQPEAIVLSDVRVSWDPTNEVGYGPDVCLLSGVKNRKVKKTFNVALRKAVVEVIVEIVSPEYRANDLVVKPPLYHENGVRVYIVADVHERDDERVRVELYGWRREPTGYERIEPNERGWLWLEVVQAWLGVEGTRLRLYDEKLDPIDDYTEESNARDVAEGWVKMARADAEENAKRAAAEEEAKNQALARADANAKWAAAEEEAKVQALAQADANAKRAAVEEAAKVQALAQADANAKRAAVEEAAKNQAFLQAEESARRAAESDRKLQEIMARLAALEAGRTGQPGDASPS